MTRQFWIILLAMAIAIPPLRAEDSGGFAGSFLRVGLGARALGMGNAQVATADHGYGSFYNPAALPNLTERHLAFSYSDMSLDRRHNFIGFAMPLQPLAGVSAGWINSGVGDLRAYNSVGQDVGEISHGLNALYFSFGVSPIALAQADKALKGLPTDLITIGLSVKFVWEDISDNEDYEYDGSGVGADLGVLIRPHRRLTFGYQLKDVNARLESNTNDLFDRGSQLDNAFPLTQKVGAFFHTPLDWLSAAYDFEWNDAGREEHHMGVEMVSPWAIGRLGLDDGRVTVGGGIDFRAYRRLNMVLDYAFVDDVVDEGISHVFSWQMRF